MTATTDPGKARAAAATGAAPAGPWARCWAKLIDLWLAAGVVFALWKWALSTLQNDPKWGPLATYFANDQGEMLFWALVFSLMAASFVVDALVQWALGVTPGLALVSARLVGLKRPRLSLGEALGRNLDVWILGFWICIPWIPMMINYGKLAGGGVVNWDERWQTRIVNRNGRDMRTLSVGFAWLCLMGAYLWLIDRLGL